MSQEPEPSWILEIRRRLEAPPPRRLAPSEARQAAVLVPLYVDAGQLWTVLVRRSDALRNHRGQIAFPGGGCESGEDPWTAALRESSEEIGLAPTKVLRLGQLDEVATPTGFRVVPCVGAVPFPLESSINRDEIAEMFALPLLAFASLRAVEERQVRIDGVERTIRVYHVGSRQVWGVTAVILGHLLSRLGLESALDSLGVSGAG
jgi:8-oxo-dGTP pyrophosphatase MutT (NUDIX family)